MWTDRRQALVNDALPFNSNEQAIEKYSSPQVLLDAAMLTT